MGNCLVTKLKATVANDGLQALGKIIIDIKDDDTPISDRLFSISGSGNITATIVSGNIYFTDSTGTENRGTVKTGTGNIGFFVSSGAGRILVEPKYEINLFGTANTYYEFATVNLEQFDYLNANYPSEPVAIELNTKAKGDVASLRNVNLKWLNLAYSKATGMLHCKSYAGGGTLDLRSTNVGIDFSQEKVKFSTMYVSGCPNVIGTLSDCANDNLEFIQCFGSSLTGSVESFFEKLWSLGRRTGNVTIITYLPNTFNGKNITVNTTYVGTFSNSGISVKVESNEVGSYDGTTWVYNS